MRMLKFRFLTLVVLVAVLFAGLFTGVAMAQGTAPPADTGALVLPDTDIAKQMFIKPLFGPLTGDESATSGLTEAVKIFCSMVLFFGGVLFAYTVVVGVIQSNTDGKLMGKQWSGWGIALRVPIGTMMIMPVISGGWSAVQVIVLWVAMQGLQAANLVWEAFIGNGKAILATSLYLPTSSTEQIKGTIMGMVAAQVCLREQNIRVAEANDASGGVGAKAMNMVNYSVHEGSTAPSPDGSQSFTFAFGTSASKAECGSWTVFSKGEKNENQSDDNDGAVMGTGGRGNSDLENIFIMSKVRGAINAARVQALRDIQGDIARVADMVMAASDEPDPVASGVDDKNSPERKIGDEILRITKLYGDTVSSKVQEQADTLKNEEYLERMTRDGIATAGGYFMRIVYVQNILSASMAEMPAQNDKIDKIKINNENSARLEKALKLIQTGNDMTLAAQGNPSSIYPMTKPSEGESEGGSEGLFSLVKRITSSDQSSVEGVMNTIGGVLTGDVALLFDRAGLNDNSINPIVMASGIGATINTAISSALMAAALFALATFGAGASVMLGLLAILGPLLVPASVLQFYLPMMPYMIWIGGMLAWAIMLVEAIVAGPMWAVMMLVPSGDGVIGRSSQGYTLLLGLFIRPMLMVFGLIAAIALTKELGSLISYTFYSMLVSTFPGHGGLTGIIRTAAVVTIYCVFMYTMVNRAFALIHLLPDRTMRWAGGGGGGEFGEQAGTAAETMSKAGATISSAGVAKGALGTAGSAIQKKLGSDAAKKANEKEKKGESDKIRDATHLAALIAQSLLNDTNSYKEINAMSPADKKNASAGLSKGAAGYTSRAIGSMAAAAAGADSSSFRSKKDRDAAKQAAQDQKAYSDGYKTIGDIGAPAVDAVNNYRNARDQTMNELGDERYTGDAAKKANDAMNGVGEDKDGNPISVPPTSVSQVARETAESVANTPPEDRADWQNDMVALHQASENPSTTPEKMDELEKKATASLVGHVISTSEFRADYGMMKKDPSAAGRIISKAGQVAKGMGGSANVPGAYGKLAVLAEQKQELDANFPQYVQDAASASIMQARAESLRGSMPGATG